MYIYMYRKPDSADQDASQPTKNNLQSTLLESPTACFNVIDFEANENE